MCGFPLDEKIPEIKPAPNKLFPSVLAFPLCGNNFAGIIEYANIPIPIPVYLLNIPSKEIVCGVFAPGASLKGRKSCYTTK